MKNNRYFSDAVKKIRQIKQKQYALWIVVILSIYFLGVALAYLNGNVVIHEASVATMKKFIAIQQCDTAPFMAKAKLNIHTSGALSWRSYPVMTMTTAILDYPECFGTLISGMTSYSGHFEIEVREESSKKMILRVVKD